MYCKKGTCCRKEQIGEMMSELLHICKLNVKKRLIYALIVGMILSFCLTVGFCLETWGTAFVGIGAVCVYILLSVLFGGIVYVLYAYLERQNNKTPCEDRVYTCKQKAVRIFGYSVAVFCGWMPSFLGVYPGWFTYDAPWQLSMYIDGNITTHHPVLHTVWMGWILEFMNGINGTYNKGIALYLVMQMGILALCMGYAVYFMEKHGVKKIGRVVAILWFVLFPPIVLHAMSTTKDTLFSGFLLVFFILSYEFLREPQVFVKKKPKMVMWVVTLFLCIVFRQNALYAFLLMAVPVVILLRKYWKYIGGMIVAMMVLYMLYTGPFYKLFSVEPGSKAEFLSVPCQQVVKVYLDQGENLTPEQKAKIEKLFAAEAFTTYRPKLADFTKGNIDMTELDENAEVYMGLYLELFLQYPKEYIDAFLLNMYGFWYPDATLDIYKDEEALYFSAIHVPPAVQNSKIPFLYRYYEEFGTGFPVQDAGVLTWALSMAVYFYGLIVVLGYVMYRGNIPGIMTGVTTLLIWLTFLLGPVAMVRYVLFLYVLPPIEYVLLTKEGKVF